MAVQIYYQLIRDIVIDEQLLSSRSAESSCFLFVWNLIKSAAQQLDFFFGSIFIINIQNASLSLTMHQGSLVQQTLHFLTSHTAMILSFLPSVTRLLDVTLKSFIKLSFHTMFFIQMSLMHFLVFLQEICKTMSFFACGRQKKLS